MGTIISEGTQDRYWYVRKLIHLVGKMEFEFESLDRIPGHTRKISLVGTTCSTTMPKIFGTKSGGWNVK